MYWKTREISLFLGMCEGSLSYEGMTCMYCGRRVTGNLKFRYYYLFLVHNSWDCCAVKVSPIYVGWLSKGSSKTSNKLMCGRHSYVKSNSIYYCFLVFNEGISFQALELLWAQCILFWAIYWENKQCSKLWRHNMYVLPERGHRQFEISVRLSISCP